MTHMYQKGTRISLDVTFAIVEPRILVSMWHGLAEVRSSKLSQQLCFVQTTSDIIGVPLWPTSGQIELTNAGGSQVNS